jgi:hypothetical protein
LSTSNNGIDGSVLVDFLNVKVAPPIFPNSSAFSVVLTAVLPVGIDKPSPACNDRHCNSPVGDRGDLKFMAVFYQGKRHPTESSTS